MRQEFSGKEAVFCPDGTRQITGICAFQSGHKEFPQFKLSYIGRELKADTFAESVHQHRRIASRRRIILLHHLVHHKKTDGTANLLLLLKVFEKVKDFAIARSFERTF